MNRKSQTALGAFLAALRALVRGNYLAAVVAAHYFLLATGWAREFRESLCLLSARCTILEHQYTSTFTAYYGGNIFKR
jgi:hypothetical protein